MKEESTKLGEVVWDRPLLLCLLQGKAGLQTSTAFTNHLLTRISSLIITFTRTKDSSYFDEEIICLLGASFGEVSG